MSVSIRYLPFIIIEGIILWIGMPLDPRSEFTHRHVDPRILGHGTVFSKGDDTCQNPLADKRAARITLEQKTIIVNSVITERVLFYLACILEALWISSTKNVWYHGSVSNPTPFQTQQGHLGHLKVPGKFSPKRNGSPTPNGALEVNW